MNAQEHELLSRFLTQLQQAGKIEKDPEADKLIQDAIKQQPDAAYLLVQRALLLEQALNTSKLRITQLEQAKAAPSFLGNAAADPWARPAPATGNTGVNRAVPAAGSVAMQPGAAYPPPTTASTGGSFLGNVATTAAGVVAGSFLFQGLENMMHGGMHHGGGWDNDQTGLQDHLSENTTINNYYGNDALPGDNALAARYDGATDTPGNFVTTDYDTSDSDDDFSASDSDDSWI